MDTKRQRNNKKRARASSPESGDESKKRGRPRVDKQDESAADRRRTQIRMAQRAYRQRKESTLEELRQRVSELTETMEAMNKAFLDCRDRLTVSTVRSSQMADLDETARQFDSLMKAIRNPGSESSPPPSLQQTAVVPRARNIATITQGTNVQSWLDETALKQSQKPFVPWGYEVNLPESEEESRQPTPIFTFEEERRAIKSSAPPAVTSILEGYDLSLNLEGLTNPLLPDKTVLPPHLSTPTTFSFQESTFGRRLHRACLEAAYQLLLDPTRKPQTYEKVFRLSYMGRDREKLTAALHEVLARGPHEPLDFWQAPLIHVGGAGTHYPRRDAFGNRHPKKTSYNLGIVGPQTLALLNDAAKNNLSTDMTVEIAGYGGEWFDPYDVEGYLEERGIIIDPASSFAEASIVEWPELSDVTTASSGRSPHTPQPADFSNTERAAPFNAEQMRALDSVQTDVTKWNDAVNMTFTGVGYSDALTGSWMNFLEPGQGIVGLENSTQTSAWETLGGTELMQDAVLGALDSSNPYKPPQTQDASMEMFSQATTPRKRSVIIDVSKFIKVLTVGSVCLGRAPGYKRRDVDRALALSTIDL